MSIVLKPYDEAASCIQTALQKALAEKPVLLLLSGGSATKLYEEMASSLALEFSPGRLELGLVDERWSPDTKHKDSNDVSIRPTGLVQKLESLGAHFQPILAGGSRDEDAAAFNRRLDNLTQKFQVILILGIGKDGHTAGMLPDKDEAAFAARFDNEALAIGYDAGDGFAGRITATMPLLRQARHSFVVAPNPDKEPILKRLLDPAEVPLHTFPAKIMYEMSDVTILGTLSEEDLL